MTSPHHDALGGASDPDKERSPPPVLHSGSEIRVAALTSGRYRPSTRFRVRQHIEPLAKLGIDVAEFLPRIDKYARLPGWPAGLRQAYVAPLLLLWNAVKLGTRLPGVVGSWRHQITWLQRELLPGLPSLEGMLKHPVVFDVDDAVWLDPPLGDFSIRRIARRCAVVLAGNSYLADWFSQFSGQVHVIPTAIDTERFRPSGRIEDRPFTIGWTGLSSNLRYLRPIAGPLRRFMSEHRDSRLLVMADERLNAGLGEQLDCVFWPWSEHEEVASVQGMDVGLMPLPDNDWTRGKCSFKMLQYMACGVPVVASPVGMNAEVLGFGDFGFAAMNADEWYQALELLYRERERAREMGSVGRQVVEQRFALPIVCQQLSTIFRHVVGL